MRRFTDERLGLPHSWTYRRVLRARLAAQRKQGEQHIPRALPRLLRPRRLVLGAVTLWFALMPATVPYLGRLDLALFDAIQPVWSLGSAHSPVAYVAVPAGSTPRDRQLDAIDALPTRLAALSAQGKIVGLALPESWQSALTWSDRGNQRRRALQTAAVVSEAAMAPSRERWISLSGAGVTIPAPSLLMIHGGMPSTPTNHPAMISGTAYQPLLTRSGKTVDTAFATALWMLASHRRPTWNRNGILVADGTRIATDPAGAIYTPQSKDRLRTVSWNDFLQNPPADVRIWVLGADGDLTARQAALTTSALMAGHTAHSPAWGIVLGSGAVLLVGLFLGFRRHLGLTVGVLAATLLAVALLAGQWSALLGGSLWLPMAPALMWLLLGCVSDSLLIKAAAAAPPAQMNRLRLELARRQVDLDEPEAARATLSKCPPSPQVLEVLYDIGLHYEQARHFDKAGEIYRFILNRQRGFRDVAQRVQRLPTAGAGGFDATQTLVMRDSIFTPSTLGRYEIERELGRGAMGTVYLATDPMIGRKLAIKAVDFSALIGDERETFRGRFFREAEAAGRLSHPHIVTVFDAGEEQNTAYLAMDYVPGETLAHFARPDRLLTLEAVYRLLAQAAEALDYAHRQRVIHRDVKPGNMIYNQDEERIKVTDFGIARVTDGTRTRTGTIMGSPSYMSPEQLAGETVDGRSDVFSLGVTLFQLLTGQLPFQGESLASLAYQITKARQPNIREVRPDLPASAKRIVNKAMQKKPADRFQSAAEMAEQLQRSADRVSA